MLQPDVTVNAQAPQCCTGAHASFAHAVEIINALYRIAQIFVDNKTSLNAHALYWHSLTATVAHQDVVGRALE